MKSTTNKWLKLVRIFAAQPTLFQNRRPIATHGAVCLKASVDFVTPIQGGQ